MWLPGCINLMKKASLRIGVAYRGATRSGFAGEIQLLAKAAGVGATDSPLPAVVNGSVGGRRLFKDRRERRGSWRRIPDEWIREVESSLVSRIGLLESKLEAQAQQGAGLGNRPGRGGGADFESFMGAMESAWSQGPAAVDGLAAAEVAAQPLVEPRRSGWKRGLGFCGGADSGDRGSCRSWAPWSRSPELPVVRPIVAPVLAEASVQPVANVAKPAVAEAESTPKIKQTPPESAAMLHQISLEIPDDLRSAIKEQAFVNVSVAIDPKGKVTTAEVESTKGDEADLLTDEALRVARRFRFRPGRQGSKSVASQMVLTFVFDPEPLPGN